jgi:hypothetical protein
MVYPFPRPFPGPSILKSFSVLSLFSSGEQGAWYDPSDFNTMFQDSAGTTPVTAVEQPVGLLLDKSKGLALGAEIISVAADRDFSSNTGYWSFNGGVGISGGTMNWSATADSYAGYTTSNSITTPGKYYEITWTLSSVSSGGIKAGVGNQFGVARTTTGTYTDRVLAGSASNRIGFFCVGTTTASIDNVSVKEVSGNHASQSTAASRPVLSARVNLLTYSEQFDNAAWTKGGLVTAGMSNVTTAPDGTTTADQLIETAATAVHYAEQSDGATTAATNYTASVAIKANGRQYATVSFTGTAATLWVAATFDLSGGGSVSNTGNGSSATYVSSSITSLGSGWFRCTVTGSLTSASTGVITIQPSNSGTPTYGGYSAYSYTGDGTSGLYIWGADLRVTNVGVGLPAYQRVGAAVTATTNPAVTGVPDYDTSGFPLYLRSDGVDDRLIGPAISNIISASAYEACIGARVISVSTDSSSPWANHTLVADDAGYVGMGYARTSNIIGAYNFDTGIDTSTVSMTPPSTFVLQQRHDAGNLVLSLNGGAEASTASGDTAVVTGNLRLFSALSSVSIPARLYGVVIRNSSFTATERANALAWMNGKTGAY